VLVALVRLRTLLTEKIEPGDVVPMPTELAKYAFPVVVAPPLTVSPPFWLPLPIVDDAVERNPFRNFVIEENILLPEKVLLSESSVEDAELPAAMPSDDVASKL
jgi:hypothetical protein